jgi:hypothetical protein
MNLTASSSKNLSWQKRFEAQNLSLLFLLCNSLFFFFLSIAAQHGCEAAFSYCNIFVLVYWELLPASDNYDHINCACDCGVEPEPPGPSSLLHIFENK